MPRAGGFDHDLTEQAVGVVAHVAVRAGGHGRVADDEHAFLGAVERVGTGTAISRRLAVGVVADVGTIVGDAADQVQAGDVESDPAFPRHVVEVDGENLARRRDDLWIGSVDLPREGWNRRRQEVLQIDGQAVALPDAQHERTLALVAAQVQFARRRRTACRQRRRIGQAGCIDALIDVHHVAPEREHRAVDVARPEAVVHDGLVEGHHVRRHGPPGAIDRRIRRRGEHRRSA